MIKTKSLDTVPQFLLKSGQWIFDEIQQVEEEAMRELLPTEVKFKPSIRIQIIKY